MLRDSPDTVAGGSFEIEPEPVPPRPSGEYRFETVSAVADLEKYADEWDRLVERAPNRVHTISHAWVASFFEHLVNGGADCRCLLALEGDALVGVMPLLVSKKYLSLLTKSEVCPPKSPQTFAADVVCRREDDEDIICAMVMALDRFLPSSWELGFHHVSECSPIVSCFSKHAHRMLAVKEFDGHGNFVPTNGSFDEYLNSLRPNFARNLRRVNRKFERLAGSRIDFVTGSDANGSHLYDFFRLEASGWKGQRGTAILNDPDQREFYRAFTQRLRSYGRLEWHRLCAEGKVIASHLAAKLGRVLYLWKIAYDERYSAYAPGNILMFQTIKRAFESSDTEEVNCLTHSAWNKNWNMERRGYFNVTVWPKRPLPFLAGYCRVKSKSVLRKLPLVRKFYHGLRNTARLLTHIHP